MKKETRDYLEKENLMESHKQFMRLCEAYMPMDLEEADDEENNQEPNQQNQQEPTIGDQGIQQGQGMQNGGGMRQGIAQQPDMGGAEGAASADGPQMQDDNMQDPGTIGNDDMGGGLPPVNDIPEDGEGEAELDPNADEDVLDVDDLTNAQEKLNNKQNTIGKDLGDVDGRITKLMAAVDKMQGVIDSNNKEITDLKAELQKRVPTETEKLNLRSLDSYPFNVNPKDYWEKKAKESNYSAYSDNEGHTDKEYVITNDDVDHLDGSNIAKSFENLDDLSYDMKRIFGL